MSKQIPYSLQLPWVEQDDIHSVMHRGFHLAISFAEEGEYIACVDIGPWCCSETWPTLEAAKFALVQFVDICGREWKQRAQ